MSQQPNDKQQKRRFYHPLKKMTRNIPHLIIIIILYHHLPAKASIVPTGSCRSTLFIIIILHLN